MDPLSHAIVGRLLIGVDPRRRAGAGAGAAAALGALSPDLDAVFMPIAWDLYLRVHQVGTHTIVGSLACAALVAMVVRLLVRHSRWRWLAAAAWAGALSHVALDVVSGATVRPLWPFADDVVRFGLVGMAEPSIVAMLAVAGIVLWRWPARHTNVAATCLVLLSVLLAGKALLRAEARRLYESAAARDGVQSYLIDAEWGAFSRWVVIDRTADRVRRWRVDTSRSTVAREIDLPGAAQTGPIAVASHAGVAENFLAAHDFPIAVTTDGAEEATVRWSDLQYCWTPGAPGAAPALVGSPVRPVDLPIACGLWFGVAVDAQNEIARQFVTIGEWTQRR